MNRAICLTIGLFGISAILSLIGFVLRSELASALIPVGAAVSGGLILLFASKLPSSLLRFIGVALMLWLIGLGLASIFALMFQPRLAAGTVIFFSNINLLAASLSVVAVSAYLLLHHRTLRLTALAVGVLSIAVIGTRTALFAIFIAALVGILTEIGSTTRRRILISAGLLVAIGTSVFFWNFTVNLSSGHRVNLLQASEDFTNAAWNIWTGANVTLTPSPSYLVMDGDKHRVTRLIGENNTESSLLLYSSVGTSVEDQDYIASIWIRSDVDTPQMIRLSSHLAYSTCPVENSWRRCVTPPAKGDGRKHVQLRLETAGDQSRVNILMTGAQIEQSSYASALERQQTHPLTLHLSRRLNSATFWLDSSRQRAFEVAWTMFRANPIVGTGVGSFASYFSDMNTSMSPDVNHAHNLILQLLAETGVIGLLAWALPFFGSLWLIKPTSRLRIFPIIILVLILNLTDLSFYHSGVYYLYWLVVGAIGFGRGAEN